MHLAHRKYSINISHHCNYYFLLFFPSVKLLLCVFTFYVAASQVSYFRWELNKYLYLADFGSCVKVQHELVTHKLNMTTTKPSFCPSCTWPLWSERSLGFNFSVPFSQPDICPLAFFLGETIAALTDVSNLNHPESGGQITIFTDKTGVIKAARLLLSSVTKVLLLADRVVIKQIITSRNKVLPFPVFLYRVFQGCSERVFLFFFFRLTAGNLAMLVSFNCLINNLIL